MLEPQIFLMAIGLFFTVIGATWVVMDPYVFLLVCFNFYVVVSALVIVKALRDAQAKTNKSFSEVNKSLAEYKSILGINSSLY